MFDGAQFVDLPGALHRTGLAGRALYRDRGDNDPERLATSPQMTGPLSGETLARAFMLLDEASPAAAVFWHCHQDADRLYRHLRAIGMVYVPTENAADEAAGGDTHELVLFRHVDANVLAQIVPALEPEQFNALFGPAEALYFLPDDAWNDRGLPLVASRREGHAKARPPLRLSRENPRSAEARRARRSEARIADCLRGTAPKLTERCDDAELRRFTAESMEDGRRLGLVSEAAFGRWSYLRLATGGNISKEKGVVAYMNEPDGKSPDAKVSLLLKSVSKAAVARENRARAV